MAHPVADLGYAGDVANLALGSKRQNDSALRLHPDSRVPDCLDGKPLSGAEGWGRPTVAASHEERE